MIPDASATEPELVRIFSAYGKVVHVTIKRMDDDKSWAFLSFDSVDAALAVLTADTPPTFVLFVCCFI